MKDPGGAGAITDVAIAFAARFHGHLCSGLTLEIPASRVAVNRLGARSGDDELIAIVETACVESMDPGDRGMHVREGQSDPRPSRREVSTGSLLQHLGVRSRCR